MLAMRETSKFEPQLQVRLLNGMRMHTRGIRAHSLTHKHNKFSLYSLLVKSQAEFEQTEDCFEMLDGFLFHYRAKHPVKVHVWARISLKGSTGVFIFEGIMDAETYINILDGTHS